MEESDAYLITADKIAKAAHQLFSRYGIRAITMDDIAHDIGVSKKTVYKHFANKNALVENLVNKEIILNEANYKLLTDGNHDAVLELFLILAATKNLYLNINPSIVRELTINYPISYHKFTKHKQQFIEQAIKTCIQKGMNDALFQADLNVDVRVKFFLESFTIIFDSDFNSFKQYDVQNLATEIFGHLISGIATTRGLELIARYKSKHKLRFVFVNLTQYLKDSAFK